MVARMARRKEDHEDFLPELKRQRIEKTQKCIICQEVRSENLRKRKAVKTFVGAVKRRKDEVYNRLSGELDDLAKRELYWHSSCYSSCTSKQNIC